MITYLHSSARIQVYAWEYVLDADMKLCDENRHEKKKVVVRAPVVARIADATTWNHAVEVAGMLSSDSTIKSEVHKWLTTMLLRGQEVWINFWVSHSSISYGEDGTLTPRSTNQTKKYASNPTKTQMET